MDPEPSGSHLILPKHGGYRRLRSFQAARLVFDATVVFCERFIEKRSRTHDQMVQAARSGVQNIAEGSKASGTSKKMELKLTNGARASLEELKLDYEDFLRHREPGELSPRPPDRAARGRFSQRGRLHRKAPRRADESARCACACMPDVRLAHARAHRKNRFEKGRAFLGLHPLPGLPRHAGNVRRV